MSTGAGLEPDPSAEPEGAGEGGSGFISPNEILERRMLDAPDAIAEPVQPVTIHVGFTGAVFKDAEGKEKREVFAVLMVDPTPAGFLVFFFLIGTTRSRRPRTSR